jgi:hypothetical protein
MISSSRTSSPERRYSHERLIVMQWAAREERRHVSRTTVVPALLLPVLLIARFDPTSTGSVTSPAAATPTTATPTSAAEHVRTAPRSTSPARRRVRPRSRPSSSVGRPGLRRGPSLSLEALPGRDLRPRCTGPGDRVRQGRAVLFVKREVRLADGDAKADPTLCRASAAPLATAGNEVPSRGGHAPVRRRQRGDRGRLRPLVGRELVGHAGDTHHRERRPRPELDPR